MLSQVLCTISGHNVWSVKCLLSMLPKPRGKLRRNYSRLSIWLRNRKLVRPSTKRRGWRSLWKLLLSTRVQSSRLVQLPRSTILWILCTWTAFGILYRGCPGLWNDHLSLGSSNHFRILLTTLTCCSLYILVWNNHLIASASDRTASVPFWKNWVLAYIIF